MPVKCLIVVSLMRRSREQAHPAPGEAEHEWGPALATALWVGGDEHGHP